MSTAHPEHTEEAPATRAGGARRPGWPEIVVGLVVLAIVAFGSDPLLVLIAPGLDPVARGLFLSALSGVAGIVAFLAAAQVRIRSWEAFGVRRTTWRWMLIGLGGGVLALVLARIAAVIGYAINGPVENIQVPYLEAAGGGVFSVVLSLLFLAVLTPLGEELIFRGVVTTALLRYGAIVGVVGSALVFALMHGLNAVFFTALIVGLVAAELRRRSGSVWPGSRCTSSTTCSARSSRCCSPA